MYLYGSIVARLANMAFALIKLPSNCVYAAIHATRPTSIITTKIINFFAQLMDVQILIRMLMDHEVRNLLPSNQTDTL